MKFIFINEDVSDYDKQILLSHEIGHICDERISDSEIIYSNAQMENYANEFSHYLNKPSTTIKLLTFLLKKPILCILIFVIAISAFSGIIALNNHSSIKQETITTDSLNNLSTDMYYVTSSGKKFHKNYCKHIRYKTNITGFSLEDAVSKGYLPCLDCIGETVSLPY